MRTLLKHPGQFLISFHQKSLILYVDRKYVPLSDTWKYEEHPEVDTKHKYDLKDDLPHNSLPQVERSIHHHCRKLDEDHDEECFRDLIL